MSKYFHRSGVYILARKSLFGGQAAEDAIDQNVRVLDVAATGGDGRASPPQLTLKREPEINYKCSQRGSPLHIKYYVSDDERRKLIRDLGDSVCLLYDYYLRCAGRSHGNDSVTLEDDVVADHFGWTKNKTSRLRKKLENYGWFRRVGSRYQDGRPGVTYYIGAEAVAASLK